MKKFISLFIVLGSIAVLAGNFNGHQSIVNLGGTSLFTAPASGIYFVNGVLSLPQPTGNGNTSQSQVVAVVSKNGSTVIYQGSPGANGFTIPTVTLVSSDAVAVSVTSNAAVDQGLNVIKGDVFFGNAF